MFDKDGLRRRDGRVKNRSDDQEQGDQVQRSGGKVRVRDGLVELAVSAILGLLNMVMDEIFRQRHPGEGCEEEEG